MPNFIKKTYKILASFTKMVGRLDITAYAASTSYFLILSVVPILILICSIIPFTGISEADVVFYFQEMLPDIFDNIVVKLVSSVYGGGYTALTISALATLWSAGKGISALIQGINAVNSVEENRNYFHKRAVCCLYTLLLLVAVIVSLVLMVFGKTISEYITKEWSGFADLQGILVKPRYLYMFIILTFIFAAFYAFLPNKRMKYREQLPGAVFASLCWIGFSFFFSMYVNMFNPYSMYGSLSVFLVAMVWIYFCMLFLLFGACINRYFKPINLVIMYPNKRKKHENNER